MSYIIEPERKTPVVAEADLLVCGGGYAGFAAALCAARLGAKVLLLEKYGFLGGLITTSLVITTPPLNNGINQEVGRLLREQRAYVFCQHSGRDPQDAEAGDVSALMHAVDPELIKYEFPRMLLAAGVRLLLHAYIAGVVREGPAIKGVIMESKAGRQAVLAKMVVDATGDADIAALAGAPVREVKKPMTMMYNLAEVDVARAVAHLGHWGNLKNVLRRAMARGEVAFDLGIAPEFGAPGVHAAEAVYPGQLNVWSGMLSGLSGIDPWDLTQAELITREHVMRLTRFLNAQVPGFERARIECTSTQVGVRASRQLVGGCSPKMAEIKGVKFADTVAKPYAKNPMRLPYGALLPQGVDNLLVAGRCLSADDDALGQLRLWPVCAITGQAAGVAAALCLRHGVGPQQLDVGLLQKELEDQGMDLGL
ncbi:MAG: FAD-dependent oxidoreductase [Desulfarculus sp.]|nr:MAG: FAD-dependent oxidoreductase [Desulfarculus sp.]